MDTQQRIDLLERQLAEMQGMVAVLLAMESARCIDECRPMQLVELRERVVSVLLASPLREDAVAGAEAAVEVFLGAIRLVWPPHPPSTSTSTVR